LIDLERIIVDGLSGTVGAGDDLDLALHHPEIHKGTSKNVKFPLAYHTPPKNQGDFAKKCMNLS
jgi:hypothetical protein